MATDADANALAKAIAAAIPMHSYEHITTGAEVIDVRQLALVIANLCDVSEQELLELAGNP